MYKILLSFFWDTVIQSLYCVLDCTASDANSQVSCNLVKATTDNKKLDYKLLINKVYCFSSEFRLSCIVTAFTCVKCAGADCVTG